MVKMKLLYTDIAYLRYRDLSQKLEKQQIFDRYFSTHHKALLYIFNIANKAKMLDHLYFYSDEISNKAKCNSYSTLY